MPTAKPIIVMMLDTNNESSNIVPIKADTPNAITIETIAITSGMTAAAIAHKTTIKMIRANGIAKASPFSRSS